MSYKELHENLHRCLRTYFVPYVEFVKQVLCVEANSMYESTERIIRGLTEEEDTDNLFVGNYGYRYPLANVLPLDKAIAHGYDPETFFIQYEKMLTMRIAPYLRNKVHDHLISYIDNNPDLGVIYHRMSGKITSFNYAGLQGVEITNVSHADIEYMHRVHLQNLIDDNDSDYTKQMAADLTGAGYIDKLIGKVVRHNNLVDNPIECYTTLRYANKSITDYSSEDSPYEKADLEVLKLYAMVMVEHRAKVMEFV